MRRWLRSFLRQTCAADLTEYALLVAFLAIAVIVSLNSLGLTINHSYEAQASRLIDAMSAGNGAGSGGGESGSGSPGTGAGGTNPGGGGGGAGSGGGPGGGGGTNPGGGDAHTPGGTIGSDPQP
jgi:Flp pilus assembly pilin Flp